MNPATGKPYSRHSYRQTHHRVRYYTPMSSGELVATHFVFDLVCKREGCGFSQSVNY